MRKYLSHCCSIIAFHSMRVPGRQNVLGARLARGPPHPVTHRVRSAISMLAC